MREHSGLIIQKRGKYSMAISTVKKMKIFSRDKGECQYCGKGLAIEKRNKWHIDHVVSIASGGNNEEQNLKLSCVSCNSRKSGYSLDYFRGMMAINSSSYKGIINYKQAESLISLGAQLDLPKFVFHFEGESL